MQTLNGKVIHWIKETDTVREDNDTTVVAASS